MRLVNLLPWRRTLAQRRLRFWSAVILATLAAVLTVHGYRMAIGALDSRRQAQLAESDGVRREWVAQALEQASLRQRQREAIQQENQRRQARYFQILAWRDAILALAEMLPDETWLTRLEGDENQWRISGLARTPDALNALERAFGQHSGFRQAQLQTLARKSEGEWHFNWRFGLRHDATLP